MEKIEHKDKENKLDNKNNSNESEFQNEDYYLNENDIIKFGNIIYIVREIHIRNEKEEDKVLQKNENEKDNNNYDIYKLNFNKGKKLIFNSSYQEGIILKPKDSEDSLYLNDYNYCEHIISDLSSKENSDKIKTIKGSINQYMPPIENKSKTVKNFKFALHKCENCNKESNEDLNVIYPLRFKVSEDSEKLELIDIGRDEKKDYIILESLEIISNGPSVKYIHFIELKGNENEEYIKIGRYHETNDVINDEKTISRHHAFIKYNKTDRSLILKNLSTTSTTSVLLRFGTLNILKNKEIYLQCGETVFTTKIMAKEIYDKIEEEFKKIKEEEKRKENEELEEDKKKYKNGEYTPSNVKNFYP
jgi:pSer/pThr/pTyr-binding forkhead associated (FHA) protein